MKLLRYLSARFGYDCAIFSMGGAIGHFLDEAHDSFVGAHYAATLIYLGLAAASVVGTHRLTFSRVGPLS